MPPWTGRPPVRMAFPSRLTRARTCPACRLSTSFSPGDRAVVALPGSTDPDVAIFLDGLGVRPGVEVEIREKHPFDGPLVVSVDGHDRTIGEKVARQILVRTDTTNHRRKEPSDHGTTR